MVRTEDQHRFEIFASGWTYDGATLTIACDRCDWRKDYDQPTDEAFERTTLADLIDAADEHAEVCR